MTKLAVMSILLLAARVLGLWKLPWIVCFAPISIPLVTAMLCFALTMMFPVTRLDDAR